MSIKGKRKWSRWWGEDEMAKRRRGIGRGVVEAMGRVSIEGQEEVVEAIVDWR